jgi:hypothetical protein
MLPAGRRARWDLTRPWEVGSDEGWAPSVSSIGREGWMAHTSRRGPAVHLGNVPAAPSVSQA